MSETNEAFLNRMRHEMECGVRLFKPDCDRLLALALRGAQSRHLEEAAQDIVDFHNAPLEMKRPDLFQVFMRRLCDALPPPALGEPE